MSRRTKRSLPVWLPPVILLVAAAAVRLVYLAYYQSLPDWEQLTVDNYYHHHWAITIAHGDILGDTTYFRAPLYVWCLGGLYALAGPMLWAGRLFGLAIGVASVGVTYLLAKRLFDRPAALIAGGLQALFPVMLYFESELLLDPLFTLLLQLSLFMFIRWWTGGRMMHLIASGMLLGLAAITRPTALIILSVFLVAAMFKADDLLRRARQAALVVLAALAIVAPVFVRNLTVADDPVLISSQGGINFYLGNNPSADGISAAMPEPLGADWKIEDITYIAERASRQKLKPGGVSSYWYRRSFEWIAGHPLDFMSLTLKKLYYTVADREVSNNRSLRSFFQRIPLLKYNPLTFGLLFALAIVAVIAWWRQSSSVRVIAAIIVAYTITTALFFFSSRFRLPLLPLYIVLAAGGVTTIWNRWRTDRRRIVAPLLAGAGAAVISFGNLAALPAGVTTSHLISDGLRSYHHGDYRAAISTFRRTLAVDPKAPRAHLNLGSAWLRNGNPDSAQYQFMMELRQYPQRAEAWSNLATVAMLTGDQVAARQRVNRAVQYRPYDLNANRQLIRIVAADSDADPTVVFDTALAAAVRTDSNATLLFEAATLLSERAPNAAIDLLATAAAAQPPPIETDDAAFTAVWPNHPDSVSHRRAEILAQLAFVYGRQRRYADAVSAARSAISADTTVVRGYVNLAAALVSIGQLHAADSVITDAIRRFPDNDTVRSLRP